MSSSMQRWILRSCSLKNRSEGSVSDLKGGLIPSDVHRGLKPIQVVWSTFHLGDSADYYQTSHQQWQKSLNQYVYVHLRLFQTFSVGLFVRASCQFQPAPWPISRTDSLSPPEIQIESNFDGWQSKFHLFKKKKKDQVAWQEVRNWKTEVVSVHFKIWGDAKANLTGIKCGLLQGMFCRRWRRQRLF